MITLYILGIIFLFFSGNYSLKKYYKKKQKKIFDRCGIRTHEAEAIELESIPFDRSGNLSERILMILSAEGGIRTHEAEAIELKSIPFDRSGTPAVCI